MIGHIILLFGYILQLYFIGKSFAYERDAATHSVAVRWKRIRFWLTVGIFLPMALAFVCWWIEYELARAVTMSIMEGIPIAIVLGFALKMIYSINAD